MWIHMYNLYACVWEKLKPCFFFLFVFTPQQSLTQKKTSMTKYVGLELPFPSQMCHPAGTSICSAIQKLPKPCLSGFL